MVNFKTGEFTSKEFTFNQLTDIGTLKWKYTNQEIIQFGYHGKPGYTILLRGENVSNQFKAIDIYFDKYGLIYALRLIMLPEPGYDYASLGLRFGLVQYDRVCKYLAEKLGEPVRVGEDIQYDLSWGRISVRKPDINQTDCYINVFYQPKDL